MRVCMCVGVFVRVDVRAYLCLWMCIMGHTWLFEEREPHSCLANRHGRCENKQGRLGGWVSILLEVRQCTDLFEFMAYVHAVWV